MRAIAVEFARLWHRRAVGLLVVLGLAGTLTVLGFAIGGAAPPSASDRAAAQQQADQQAQAPDFQEQLQACRAAKGDSGQEESGTEQPGMQQSGQQPGQQSPGQGGAAQQGEADSGSSSGASSSAVAQPAPGPGPAVGSAPADAYPGDCEEMLPKAEWFLDWSPPDFVRDFRDHLQAVTMLLALALALAGITFAGADWNQGTMGTQLLYQPRRGVLFTAKAVAVAVLALVAGAVGTALAWVESYAVAARWGSTEMVGEVAEYYVNASGSGQMYQSVPVTGLDLVGEALRTTSIVALAALGGYLLAMIFRSSLVAVAVLAAYGIIGEAILGGLSHGIAPWLLSNRLLAWMNGPYRVVQYPTGPCNGPQECAPTVTTLSVADGGIYLAVLLAVGLAIAAWLFARRDVD